MISGAHVLVYADDAPAARTFLRDVLGWESVDDGDGWLIFALPPAELGVHPTADAERGSGDVDLYLMCGDIDATVAELHEKGVEDAEKPGHGGRPGRHAELRVDVLEVLAHRRRGDPEQLGDLAVRLAARDPGEDLALARSQVEQPALLLEQQCVPVPSDRDPAVAGGDRQHVRA